MDDLDTDRLVDRLRQALRRHEHELERIAAEADVHISTLRNMLRHDGRYYSTRTLRALERVLGGE